MKYIVLFALVVLHLNVEGQEAKIDSFLVALNNLGNELETLPLEHDGTLALDISYDIQTKIMNLHIVRESTKVLSKNYVYYIPIAALDADKIYRFCDDCPNAGWTSIYDPSSTMYYQNLPQINIGTMDPPKELFSRVNGGMFLDMDMIDYPEPGKIKKAISSSIIINGWKGNKAMITVNDFTNLLRNFVVYLQSTMDLEAERSKAVQKSLDTTLTREQHRALKKKSIREGN